MGPSDIFEDKEGPEKNVFTVKERLLKKPSTT